MAFQKFLSKVSKFSAVNHHINLNYILSDKTEHIKFVSTNAISRAMTKIASLVDESDEIAKIDERLKFSKKEYEEAYFIVGQKSKIQSLYPDFQQWPDEKRFEYYFKLKTMLANNILNEEIFIKAEVSKLHNDLKRIIRRIPSLGIPKM